MPRLLTIIAALGMAALAVSPARAATPNDTARILAGMPPAHGSPLEPLTQDPAWQFHARLLDNVWGGLEEQQLSKVRSWSRTHVTARRPVTYYFFSGPDFLYADAFLPDASTYILAGLEPIGPLPDVLALRARSLDFDLEALRTSISTLLSRSYFITSYMGADLSASQLRGTLPVLYVFLARTGKTIHEVSFVTLKKDGSVDPSSAAKDGTRGVKIVFSGPGKKQQTLYYFRTDLANKGVQASGFLEFCRKFGIGDVFIKAASYLLHTPQFSIVRDFLLGHGATVVQDDTGVPLRYFEQRAWKVQPFGRYVGPIPVFRGNFQNKLKVLFDKSAAPPIDFGIGYRWRLNESHVILALNPDQHNLAAAASDKPGEDKAGAGQVSTPERKPPPERIAEPEKKAVADQTGAPSPHRGGPANAEPPKGDPPPQVAGEAWGFVRWPSVLFGGLFSAALVGMFGLEGIAAGLGFILQAIAIGAVAWFAVGHVRARHEQAAVVGAPTPEDVASEGRAPTEAPGPQQNGETAGRSWPISLAQQLRRLVSR